MTEGGSKAALLAGSAFMHDLGSLFPVAMTLAGDELVFTFVSSCPSSGEIEQWAKERSGRVLAGRMPRFFIDARGQRIGVELAGTRVRALIVLADEMTGASVNAPHLGRWQDQMPCTVRVALDELARMLSRCRHRAGGADPLIDLNLAYRPDRDYHTRLNEAHEKVRPFIAPVRPVLSLRWRSATSLQRKAFLDELPDGPPERGWLRRRRTVRIMGLELEMAP
ncbi:hypothetical protein HFP15_23485 [Amycolatopsis sp. K13G38]|uniref:Uncharacterized protein n=1 Tax=Amycolatopsis acididurans TaxID=2724524 RepID=A0ABX1J7V8_9PSEU|nr:hypothetical protein [Amycolatopsis acididurans]NKQ55843.1 hypothetical protein [Amycolatopsis acididurans]